MTKLLFLLLQVSFVRAVVELGSEFTEVTELSNPHLVLFYAPWCGHCRSLHPLWQQIGSRLLSRKIVTAKIDATLYRGAAEKYNVKGFPAIRLIGYDRVLDYHGDRTLEDLTAFAIAGSRPFLVSMGSMGKFNDLKKTEDVIFSLKNPSQEMKLCASLAVTHIIHQTLITEVNNDVFLPVSDNVSLKVNNITSLRLDMTISRSPGIVVLKDNMVLEYTGDLDNCHALSQWIFGERFAAFQKGSYPVIHPLLFLSSKIVFLYSVHPTTESNEKMKEMKTLSTKRVEMAQFGDIYYVHVDQAEFLENLISGYVTAPSVLVYDPTTERYTYTTNLTISLEALISDFVGGRGPVWGGSGVLSSCKKVWFRIHSTVWPLFLDHPFIMLLVVSIPIGLISLCCWDEMRSKNDPIRKICEDKSDMDLLWGDIEYEDRTEECKAKEEVEEIEDKEPLLKKEE